ncbi:GIY-YIG nuclease family protein, partial [Cronobacter sakazakii]
MEEWFLYLIRCPDNRLYTGITTDVARRFAQH